MLIGGIVGWSDPKDDLFDVNSSRNRDDCLAPFRVLREKASVLNIQLHTIDVLIEKNIKPNFNLYIESVPIIQIENCKNYLIRFETELTVPINGDPSYLSQFDGIFTWDLDFLDPNSTRFLSQRLREIPKFPIAYPNVLPADFKLNTIVNSGFANRDLFCVLIGSNRHANVLDSRELYSERVKAIRWFESHAPNDFSLFGNGWRVPQKRLGSIGKLQYRFEKIMPFVTRRAVFPSYQGPANTKFEVYSRSKFSICFENAKDIRGYITEKIFDCLFAGCVPIYWGDPAIEEFVPKACFIDFRQFQNKSAPCRELYSYIKNMNEVTFLEYQQAGRDFLSSPGFAPFTSEAFAESILRPIES
jgi:hypothetical protein